MGKDRNRWKVNKEKVAGLAEVSDIDLVQIRHDLVDDVQRMQTQLTNKNRKDEGGTRMDDAKYHEWRGRANEALQHHLSELRVVKAEIHKRNPQTVSPKGHNNLIGAILASEIGLDAIDMDQEELDSRVMECLQAAERLKGAWDRTVESKETPQ